jgi:hypothetical protein
MTNMNANEFLKAVDHAASMNDRWLFLAAFCLLLVLCGVVIYWLVKHLQSVMADHKVSREAHHVALEKVVNTQNETTLKLAVCIDRNTAVLTDCSFELRRFQERLSVGLLAIATVLLCGCAGVKPLKPGAARTRSIISTNGVHEFVSEMKQPENPAQSAAQNFERTTETELPLASGTKVTETVSAPDSAGRPVVTEKTIVLAVPTVQKMRVTEKAGTVIGAAQKDTAREIGAKLASLKGLVWVGLGLFVFGLVSLFYPPLKAIIGSVTTSLAILAGGVALMILPSLVVGNELLILGGVALAIGGWFLAHRHGQLRGTVEASKVGSDGQGAAKTASS